MKKILTNTKFFGIIGALQILYAGVAQSVVQLIRNQQVVCSSHITSSKKALTSSECFFYVILFFLHARKAIEAGSCHTWAFALRRRRARIARCGGKNRSVPPRGSARQGSFLP